MISKNLSSLKNSLRIQKIANSPKLIRGSSQNNTLWLNLKKFSEKQRVNDSSILSIFNSNYTNSRSKNSRLSNKRNLINEVNSSIKTVYNTSNSTKRSIIMQK